MKARTATLLGVVLLLAAGLSATLREGVAQEPPRDRAELQRSAVLIGEHVQLRMQVLAPAGATVELTPGTPGWADVELVSVDEVTQAAQGDGVLWFITATVAAFFPGELQFAPSYTLIQGADATLRSFPPLALTVANSLGPDAELILSPLPPPRSIPGAESPLLRPVIVVALALGLAIAGLLLWLAVRTVLHRLRRAGPVLTLPETPASLDGAEQLLHSDPVGAYRLMSSVVKNELARRYGVRATALTTTELRRRLETGGDRWEARLVGGLLEECDAVIYAGYRPAAERRQHDLTMAREIIEAPS